MEREAGEGAERLRIRLIGRLSVERDGVSLPAPAIGSRKARMLLAILASEGGRRVATDRIAEALWDEPPVNADRLIATLVSRLRRTLGREAIEGTVDGYRFAIAPDRTVDLDDVARLVDEAERRLDVQPSLTRTAAERALGLLDAGDLLADEPDARWAEPARATVAQLARRARRGQWQAALALRDAGRALATTEQAMVADPLDEEAHRAAMLAHQMAGRPGQALLVYERLRRTLADELGTAPAPETRAVHLAILREQRPASEGPKPSEHRVRPRPTRAVEPRGEVFVGRGVELARLTEAWEAAVAGHAGIVAVTGEAGIGKSALVRRVETLASRTGGSVLRATCYEAERSLFLQPIADALGPIVDRGIEVVHELSAEQVAALAEILPDIGAFWAPTRLESAAPEIARRRVFEGTAALLRALARRSPLLLVLDDLHNAGLSTVELLHFLSRRLAGDRLLVVATVRTEEGDDVLARLAPVALVVALHQLPEPAVHELAERMGAGRFAERVHALAGGHPLFVVELLRALGEREPAADDAGIAPPESLRDAVTVRARRAGSDVDEFLRCAAVFGTAVDPFDAAALVGLSAEDGIRLAERARRRGLLVESPAGLAFSNDLVREILYATTPPSIRAARHRRAFEIVAGNAEAQGVHAEAAGLWAEAAQAFADAADQAFRRHANADAAALLGRALDAARRANHLDLELRARTTRARVREALDDYQAAFDDQTSGLELARRIGDPRLIVRALSRLGGSDVIVGLGRPSREREGYLDEARELAEEIDDRPALVAILARLSILATSHLEAGRADALAGRAVDLARALHDDEALSVALDARKAAHAYAGDLAALAVVLAEIEPLLRRRDDVKLLQWTIFESSFLPLARANWDAADARVGEALALNARTGYHIHEAFFLAHRAWIQRARGESPAAIETGGRAADLAAAAGHPWWIAFANGVVGWTLTEAGDLAAAARCLEVGLGAAEQDGSGGFLARVLGQLALARWLAGEGTAARPLAARAEALLLEADDGGARPMLHAAHAPIAVARVWLGSGEPERARRLLEPVLAAAGAAGWLEFEASAALRLGEAWIAADDARAARPLLERARKVAGEAGLAATRAEADEALARLTGAAR